MDHYAITDSYSYTFLLFCYPKGQKLFLEQVPPKK